MEYDELKKEFSDDENSFETFGHCVVHKYLLRGDARRNYQRAPKQAPYDGETRGEYFGHRGRILFEYKGGQNLSAIRDDLVGTRGKLHRVRNENAAAYILVLGLTRPTAPFMQSVKGFIDEEALGFCFECVPPDVLERVVRDHPSVVDQFRRRQMPAGFEDFLRVLQDQKAPVHFHQYQNLEKVFVRPREYDKIIQRLKANRIVLIVGPPHVGKTFTAVRILRHFHEFNGCDPRWVLAREPGRERSADEPPRIVPIPASSISALLEKNVGRGKITYFEDLFGSTSDEEVKWQHVVVNPENILWEIVNYVRVAQPDALVILTSREGLFDKALDASPELKKLVVRLRGKPARVKMELSSYSAAKKIELVRNYARLYDCVWFRDGNLPSDVSIAVNGLSTPHAVEFFCRLSVSAKSPAQRAIHLKTASQELVQAFVNEICSLDDITLRFLLAVGIFHCGENGFAAALPDEIKDTSATLWTEAKNRMADRLDLSSGYAVWAHPAYSESLSRALKFDPLKGVFVDMAQRLSQQPQYVFMVTTVLAKNTSRLETKNQALLSRIVRIYPVMRPTVARALASDFGTLDKYGRGLVRDLAGDANPGVRAEIASRLCLDLKRYTSTRLGLIRKLACDPDASVRAAIATGLCRDIKSHWRSLRKVVHNLASDPDPAVAAAVGQGLGSSFHSLSIADRMLLKQLANSEIRAVRAGAAEGLGLSSIELHGEGHELFAGLATDASREVRAAVASGLAANSRPLDPECHELLVKLAGDISREVRAAVAKGLASGSMALEADDSSLLMKLARDASAHVRAGLALGFSANYGPLGPVEDALLKDLACEASPRVRGLIGMRLAMSAEGLDKAGRTILRKLARDPSRKVRAEVCQGLCMGMSMSIMPIDRAQLKLLQALAHDDSTYVRTSMAMSVTIPWVLQDTIRRRVVEKLACDPSPKVRATVASGLGGFRPFFGPSDEAEARLLGRLSRDRSAKVRAAAVPQDLATIGSPALGPSTSPA